MTLPQAYCVKCGRYVEIKDPKNVMTPDEGPLSRPKPAIVGRCPKCGTRLFRILKGE